MVHAEARWSSAPQWETSYRDLNVRVRGRTASGSQTRQKEIVRTTGAGMDKIGQKLDAVICEIAAFMWLVRAGAR